MSQRNIDDDEEFDRIYDTLSRCQTELARQRPVIEAAKEWKRRYNDEESSEALEQEAFVRMCVAIEELFREEE
jgi:hypothetical protein